jgi:uncharacterized protein (UPF0333 family)
MFKQRKTRGGQMVQKKGQAAMEFLMTYGWALLVVLIAIGALAFFGVLNPSKFLPNSCSLAPGFACTDFKATATGNSIIVILQNGLGENLNSVTLSVANPNPTCTTTFAPPNTAVADGGTQQFTISCGGTGWTAGTKFKSDLRISYTIGTGTNVISHTKVGQLVVGIEA